MPIPIQFVDKREKSTITHLVRLGRPGVQHCGVDEHR
jgi:hypothetical protein